MAEAGIIGGTPTTKVLVFLNTYKNNPQAHGITIVAFHPEVSGYRISIRNRGVRVS